MKLCRFLDEVNEPVFGIVEVDNGVVFEIDFNPFLHPNEYLEKALDRRRRLGDIKLIAPVMPSKIIAVGLNYKAHAAEFGKPLPEEPMIFMKPSTAVIGPDDAIVYPTHMSHRVDYEGELGVVIGKTAKDVAPDKAKEYIFGYTCFNDVTARDLQGKDIQYTRAKGFDTFACMGPFIETELDPLNVQIETWLEGEKRQDTSTRDMIFNVYELVSFISHVMTLLPGDVIATGTPSGVGKMKPGNTVEVKIEGIGTLKNTVVEGNTVKRLWTGA